MSAATDPPKFIAVIGGGQCTSEESLLAEAVGRELARRGAVLICGGGSGIMEAACKGARQEGGTTIGILPGEDRRLANPYVTIPIVTGMGHARNMIVAKSAQAIVAIGGAYGTLTEIGFALLFGIPVVSLDTWSVSREGRREDSIVPAKDAADAAAKALSLAK